MNKNACFIGYNGLGDYMSYNGMIRYLSEFYDKIYIAAEISNLDLLFRDNEKISIVNFGFYEGISGDFDVIDARVWEKYSKNINGIYFDRDNKFGDVIIKL